MIYYIVMSFSLLINLVSFWYIYNIIKKHTIIFEITDNLLINLEDFLAHLKALYELETYYGDETLKELIVHATSTVESVEQYRDAYVVPEQEDYDIEEEPEE